MNIQERHKQQRQGESDIVSHLPTLHDAVIETGAQQVIELGVRGGNSTAALLAGLEKTGGQLWSCDLDMPGAPIRDYMGHDQWDFVQGDEFEVLREAPSTCQVLFVDTVHNYEHVIRELKVYGVKVEPGGIIMVHDTEDTGVMRACQEYADERNAEFSNVTSSHGLATIRIPKE